MAAQSLAQVVLLTRPAAQSARFAESLRARVPDVQIVTSALLAPAFLNVSLAVKPWRAVILSSETGAEAAGRIRAQLPDPAFCVGDRTAQVARAAGFVTQSAHGDADALFDLILLHPLAPLLHLRGREARGDLAKRLSASGIATEEVIVYAQQEQPLTPAAITLLQGQNPVLIPLFSPRSAEILVAECRRIAATAPLTLVVMSGAVAEAAASLCRKITVAPLPTGESMLEAVHMDLVAGHGA